MQEKKILIIEDETSISNILEYKLKKAGYIVKTANTGKDGLVQLNNFNPDLTLLDLQLPDMTGFDICRHIKNNYQKPVIILTARNTHEAKNHGKEVGADDFITKPFDFNNLLVRIASILNTSPRKTKITSNIQVKKNTQPRNRQDQAYINEIAHELKTPLTIIMGFTQLLKAENSSSIELYQTAIDSIELESKNLLDATEKVISIAREGLLY